jgi:hypothetical protein
MVRMKCVEDGRREVAKATATAAVFAAGRERKKRERVLLSRNMSMESSSSSSNSKNKNNSLQLRIAANDHEGFIERVKLLFFESRRRKQRKQRGRCPSTAAAALLAREVGEVCERDGWSALHYAAVTCLQEDANIIIRILVNANRSSLEVRTKHGNTVSRTNERTNE